MKESIKVIPSQLNGENYFFVFSKEFRLLLFICFLIFEVIVIEFFWDFVVSEVYFGGGSDDVSLIDSTNRNSINFVWTFGKKKKNKKMFSCMVEDR